MRCNAPWNRFSARTEVEIRITQSSVLQKRAIASSTTGNSNDSQIGQEPRHDLPFGLGPHPGSSDLRLEKSDRNGCCSNVEIRPEGHAGSRSSWNLAGRVPVKSNN